MSPVGVELFHPCALGLSHHGGSARGKAHDLTTEAESLKTPLSGAARDDTTATTPAAAKEPPSGSRPVAGKEPSALPGQRSSRRKKAAGG